jgi:RNA-dependent RNA polymerase
LAFGNSQFRENGAYFFCPTEEITCADIRHWMGDFTSIKIVAKYAARLGLCFSTTRAIRSNRTTIKRIEDVERNGYCFTDGVGKISDSLSVMIANQLSLPLSNPVPSAFQFRLGGGKGMLVNWPGMSGEEVHIRKSQWKFEARYDGLEIIRCSRFSPATLNRQTITILSSLGVEDEIFNKMLSEQLQNYQAAMTDEHLALDLLSRYVDDNHMTVTIASMVLDGFMQASQLCALHRPKVTNTSVQVKEPFLLSLLHLWRAWSIKLLKEKAKIIVEKGAFLLGVTDETGTLRGHINSKARPGSPVDVNDLPQVFIQVPDKTKKGNYVVIDGPCLVGRNPSLFPGDIRMVRAVNVPALHHLRDVIVFPQLGDRDIPGMCSGGDLDGDDFFCIWDKALTPKEWNVEPISYTAAKPKELNRPVEVQDIMRFFVRFMKNDALPTIAHAHLALSDYLDQGIKDPKCEFKHAE